MVVDANITIRSVSGGCMRMDDAVEGGKELLSETVQAFKAGMRGQEYIPGSVGAAALRREEELAKLQELRESGTLTDEEFIAARTRLLASESAPTDD
jgi:hypothetical protein